ncbi:family 20 glycosylhydrolase [Rhodopirellula sp. JC740]|uniref:beta-N-acetylhexosaminidase n=1 Tax=Rhodopirellula halodulae TaxID=2894198 RepID=A0ABS8NG15_9BACT|nr:family 20 glycosylhydrolase [Rhodopirellula sp. JC740]MCC9642483.1 family 20 glycosylhydrolase [Rhodopirellula sp. JC740]
MRIETTFLTLLLSLLAGPLLAEEGSDSQALTPVLADYAKLAFYPDRWKKAEADFEMLAWEGENVVFLTKKGNYSREELTAFVKRLDDGWGTYSELVGQQPRQFKAIHNKPVICALPQADLSCGHGCGYVGATGIEASAFYSTDLPNFQKDPSSFRHYYFYEMGRNFFVFGDRHSLFTTGYAVFMRYVCMDRLKCKDLDARTRKTIERCEEIYANSDIGFYEAFTNLGDGEKANRLKDAEGRTIHPSDQPVMYATAMLKLRRDHGGDEFVKRFYHTLRQCKPAKATNIESAKTQAFNWLVSASFAAEEDLTPVFADRWRMPMTDNQRRIMKQMDWSTDAPVREVVATLVADTPLASSETDAEGLSSAVVVVPTPVSMVHKPDAKPFFYTKDSRIIVNAKHSDARMYSHATVLAGELELLTGWKLPTIADVESPMRSDIVLSLAENDAIHDESYVLVAGESGVRISANSFQGIAHGTSSLLQLLDGDSMEIPAVEIEDKPSAPYRALMVDVARTPHSIGVIRDSVRLCRLYKVRYLQLHLTDHQLFTFPFPEVTDHLEKNPHYSLDELKELVAYADDRGVTIIPELDLPGHSGRLLQSGYLPDARNDADVAAPENYEKVGRIVDAMIDVFASSPYFHIGGDESGAGKRLIPFLSEINRRVRARGKRLLVWEGFHGAPTDQLPATGDDRIIVMAWESSYNAPWDLLNNGYQIINASWKPTYLTGGYGGLIHPGSTGGKRFRLEDLYRWDKSTFMHWEPGRPVFEDRGPNDPNKDDGEWNARWIGKQNQVLGGQMLYWEQYECSVVHFLAPRIPILSERLWNTAAGHTFTEFQRRAKVVEQRVMPLLQPVGISPVADDPTHPVLAMYQPYSGDELEVTLHNRTKIEGQIRYSTGGWSGRLNSPNFHPVPKPHRDYDQPLMARGPFSVRAELVRNDGTTVDGHSWQFFHNWPNRVEVTEFDIGRRTPKTVPDLASLPESKILRRYRMPYVRGLMQNVAVRGQMTESDLIAPADGKHVLEMRTQSGHATLFVDANQNGTFETEEVLVRNSPNDESGQFAEVLLRKGARYRIRIDHATGMPRPVLLLFITPPDGNRTEISQYLHLPN